MQTQMPIGSIATFHRNVTATMPAETPRAEQFYKLGMMCSTGQSMPLDMVEAHKWFNIAATMGMRDAMRLRNEVAAEMSESEIAAAQRSARDWLTRNCTRH
jgi:TPR repeat protein